jgi:hypothetical protein
MRDGRAAALKAWVTRRSGGGKAKLLPSGQRAMATNLGGRARSGPAPTSDLAAALRASIRTGSSGLGSAFHKRGLAAAHAMRQVARLGVAIKVGKRRGGKVERALSEQRTYAEKAARELAHEARQKGYGR